MALGNNRVCVKRELSTNVFGARGVRTSVMHFHSLRLGYVNQDSRPLLYDENVVLPQNVKSGRHVSFRKDCGRERTSHFEPGHRNAELPV
jgi:hypothetical protein